MSVSVNDDGTLRVRLGADEWVGLVAVEDGGDSYDADPIGPVVTEPVSVSVERRRHPSGIQKLRVERALLLPGTLDPDRDRTSTRPRPAR